MELFEIMQQLDLLGKERTKKLYISNGAKEPVFGVTSGDLKPLSKKIKKNQSLADELYATNNYDAMYLAGMIAEPKVMTEADFERWISFAYFNYISDYIVSVTLAEADFALELAKKWINSSDEFRCSAGWCTYCWVIGIKSDDFFNKAEIMDLLGKCKERIHTSFDCVKSSMNNFIQTVGISYIPLHDEAIKIGEEICHIKIDKTKGNCDLTYAPDYIKKSEARLGFKRKNVRC